MKEKEINEIMDLLIKELKSIKNKKDKQMIGNGVINRLIGKLPFELHIPGYNYCGPGTKLEKRLKRGDKGVNKVDEVCKKHDIDYSNAKNDEDIKKADRKMIENLDKLENLNLNEKMGKTICKTGLKAKQVFGGNINDIYCIRCKQFTKSKNIKEEVTKNNKPILKGTCVECGCKKNRFLSTKQKIRKVS